MQTYFLNKILNHSEIEALSCSSCSSQCGDRLPIKVYSKSDSNASQALDSNDHHVSINKGQAVREYNIKNASTAGLIGEKNELVV